MRGSSRFEHFKKVASDSEPNSIHDVDLNWEEDGRAVARMSANALKANYDAIQALVPGQSMLPMIKANAYGHGAAWAARELFAKPGLYGFGVASLEEGREVREALGVRGRKTRIIVFTGATPWTENKGKFCEAYHLSAVIQSDADWAAFLKGGWAGKIPYELMFNTGMNRLGLSSAMATSVARTLRTRPAETFPDGVSTHLAMGETPDSRLTVAQVSSFKSIQAELAPAFPSTHFHLAGSAGIWNQKLLGFMDFTDVVRPGLSLYGVPPWKGAPQRNLQAVMSFESKLIQIATLKVGESIGYGATFKNEGKNDGKHGCKNDGKAKEALRYAVLGAGYGDGLIRALGNRGWVSVRGERCALIGRVSMDLSAIRVSASAKLGDWAQLFGDTLDPWEVAEAAGTIPYEVLTSVSSRVQRIYE